MTSTPALDAVGLVRRFGSLTAVDDVSLRIATGETVGLLGPNGAGKTTAISMMAGLLTPDVGSVRVAGSSMLEEPMQAKRHLGLVPQELAIYPEISARDNLRFFGRLQGLRGGDLDARVAEVLELVGLQDRAKGPAKEFSGGMKRRLNIAIGLLHRPTLLILDEPTVGVDPQSRNAILASVEALTDEGMAVLYTTHYMEEAQRLCDRIAIMDAGRVQAEGTREELVALTGGVDTITLTGTGEVAEAETAVAALPPVQQVVRDGHRLHLSVRGAAAVVTQVVTAASRAGMELEDVQISRPDLESVFLHLTGKALRD
ncbi:ABC transporter ATP-binding protein [Ornithinimicrobium sufpigmenti]|uniref:ABC transporter ATP-binding protein n=1 Tax=Ornithinimicrobium sufpigmenti TaxID=2508882 RepID=UPI0010357E58|nr:MULTISPECIES: ABC transporter ATP-binding protein [unclassified Ornithinimicrobium]